MNRVFQNRALTAVICRVLTDNLLLFDPVNKLVRALVQGDREGSQKRIMTYQEARAFDFVHVSRFLEELILISPELPPTDLGFLPPMSYLTRLTCFHVPGIQFPESLTYLDLLPGKAKTLCHEIPFPRGLVELVLHTSFLPALGPEGLPKLDILRIQGIGTCHLVQRDWPQSLRVLARVDFGNFWVFCSRAWFQRHENLTRFSHVLLKVMDSGSDPWVGYSPRAEGILVSGFDYSLSGLTHLTCLVLTMIYDESKTLAVLSRVRMTLQRVYIHCPVSDLPEMPELLELSCHAHLDLLPKLRTRVPRVRVLGLILFNPRGIDVAVSSSWLPLDCQYLGINMNLHSVAHGLWLSCPDRLQWLEIAGEWKVHLEGEIPNSMRTLMISSGKLQSKKIPEWVRFIPEKCSAPLWVRIQKGLIKELSNKSEPWG